MPPTDQAGAGSDRASRYRPDIDGLRAVAVGLVVAQHAALGPFPGGYIGVDVFFVISGYLITGLIAADLERGAFSFRSFYERRARRILPALLAMLLVTTIAAILIMPPTELYGFAKSLPPAVFFYANQYMMRFGDYFGPGTHDMPLLHLWSVAVEEQFYIVFPVVCLALGRFGRRGLRRAVAVAALLFFVYASYRMLAEPERSYFHTLTRAWELLLGAAVRLTPLAEARRGRLAAPLRTAGLGLILACALVYDEWAGVPGITGLGPCLGAAMILAAGGAGPDVAGRLLTAAPAVWLGRRSYSIYLWHWPVLVFAGFFFADGIPVALRVALVLLTLALAALSYRYVETPFRSVGGPVPLPRLAGAALAALAMLALAYGGLRASGGLAFRLPPATRAAVAELVRDHAKLGEDERNFRACSRASCADGAAVAKPASALIVGDSHAGALAAAFAGGNALAATAIPVDWLSYCPPVAAIPAPASLVAAELGLRRECRLRAPGRSHGWLERTDVDTVILDLFWNTYDDRYAGLARPLSEPTHAWIIAEVEAMVAALGRAGKRVVVIGPIPDYPHAIPVLLERAAIGLPAAFERPRRPFERDSAEIFAALRRLAQQPNVQVVNAHEALCDADTCRAVRDGRPLYLDDDHLSRYGAALVAPLVAAAVARFDAPRAVSQRPAAPAF